MKILQDAIEQYFNATGDDAPSCIDPDTFDQWVALEKEAPTQPRKFLCRDCTPQYQKSMAGLCVIRNIPVDKIAR